MTFDRLSAPKEGQKIEKNETEISVPDNPIIPFVEGDGIGRDIMKATRRVVDVAVKKPYDGRKKIVWLEIYAGEKAFQKYGDLFSSLRSEGFACTSRNCDENDTPWLPEDTLKAIEHFVVAIKGPLSTPVGGGYRSLNVTMRQALDLFACVRPVKYIKGVPSPLKHPEKMDVVIFRENTEDVYAGIEWRQGEKETDEIISFFNERFGVNIAKDSGIGLKPISIKNTKRLVRKAIKYAIEHNRTSVTLVHKGNIMKFTEGAFKDWGYEVAKEEFPAQTITEKELDSECNGEMPGGKILIKDRIADNMFQQILTRTDEYDVIAAPNLNGDYLSDACAACIGGLGMAPGANIGEGTALFEATHGTAPKYADKNMANPSSLILSAVMMLEYLGWQEAADLLQKALGDTILQKRITCDLERQMENNGRRKEIVGTAEFASAIIENITKQRQEG